SSRNSDRHATGRTLRCRAAAVRDRISIRSGATVGRSLADVRDRRHGSRTAHTGIAIDRISNWYAATQVLRDVTMNVAKGEVVVICGPSGSGKSTVLRCINRLETVEQGTIVVDGIEVTARAPDVNRLRAEIGIVFQ